VKLVSLPTVSLKIEYLEIKSNVTLLLTLLVVAILRTTLMTPSFPHCLVSNLSFGNAGGKIPNPLRSESTAVSVTVMHQEKRPKCEDSGLLSTMALIIGSRSI
jgi:hypothetical protein